eukprot:UN08181
MNSQPKLARIYQELQKTYGSLDARTKKFTHQQYKQMQTVMERRKKQNADSSSNQLDLSEPARWFNR